MAKRSIFEEVGDSAPKPATRTGMIDAAGQVVRSHQGVLSRPELDDLLDQLERDFPTAG